MLILYGYRYKNMKKMSELLSDYVSGGGCLFIEANDSPDYKAKSLVDPFPIRDSYTYSVFRDWNFNISKHPIVKGVNFTSFSPAVFAGGGWGISASIKIADWAKPILLTNGHPIVVAGEYGKGRVIWSGMNLFYHAKSYRNKEELKFIVNILKWLNGIGGTSNPSYNVEFINPQKRIITIEDKYKGILFKEHYFTQWHATLLQKAYTRSI